MTGGVIRVDDRGEEWPDLGEMCCDWRQGDVFRGAKTFVFDVNWEPKLIHAEYGAVVVSQTCDASQPSRDRIQIAPVVLFEDSNDAKEASAGKRPRYVAVPRLGNNYFADLDGITTVYKVALRSCERIAGVETDAEVREFAFSVARRFGRFAYPNDVVACLDPLTRVLKSKARKEQSPMGSILTGVHSLRLHCDDWTKLPYDLTLIVIVEPETVPSDLDEIGPPPDNLAAPFEEGISEQIARYVSFLSDARRSVTERYYAWQYIIAAWALQCELTVRAKGLRRSIRSVTSELEAVDTFPLSRYLVTESLDLDYLSGSRKPD